MERHPVSSLLLLLLLVLLFLQSAEDGTPLAPPVREEAEREDVRGELDES